jgi:hypothetical protein
MNGQLFQQIINGWDIWLCCGIMIVMIVAQSAIFLRNAIREADHLQISAASRHSAIRAACVSSLGPSLSPVVIALSMMAIVGAPNAWMNLNNIGAARTELANISIGASFAGVSELSGDIGMQAWSYALWTCALNGAGWMLVVFFMNHRMGQIVSWMDAKYNPRWIKVLMGAAITSLFCYLLSNQIVGKTYDYYLAALISGGCMLFLTYFCKKNQILQELSLGISMLAGMLITQLLV